MDRREALYDTAAASDEGFGPGTDLVVSVLALMIVMLTLLRVNTVIAIGGDFDRQYVIRNKSAFIQSMEVAFGRKAVSDPLQSDILKIASENGDIVIQDFVTIQRIAFGTDILFNSASADLSFRGKEVLLLFQQALSANAKYFMEIQISGHADTSGGTLGTLGTDAPKVDNLRLGADRAMAVYRELLQSSPSLDPARVLISATTYGEYSPVTRSPRKRFSRQDLVNSNITVAQRQLNRRIEITIIYRLAPQK